jgi:hypothetical protein
VGVLAVLITSALGTNALYYAAWNGDRPDWRTAFDLVGQQAGPSDLVVATDAEMGEYYLGRSVETLRETNPVRLASSGRTVWFVVAEDTQRSEPSLYRWIRQNATLIDVVEAYSPGKRSSLRVFVYQPQQR